MIETKRSQIRPRDYAMTLEEIAEAIDSTPSAVSEMIRRALRKIRRREGSFVRFRQLVELRREIADRGTYL